MKDEEMAEEYADRTRIVDENTRVGTDCISLVQDYEGNYIDIHERIKQAFLAGLKAGRPQWHEVVDGDLPEKEDVFLIYTTKGFLLGHYEQGGADGKVDYCGEPYSDFTEYPSEEELVANEVIAWCEIPTFDKE